MQKSHRMTDLWHQRFADLITNAVCELSDRTSPEGEPDMVLVSINELQRSITDALAQLEENWTKQGMLVLPGWAIVSTEDLAELAMSMPPAPFTAQDGRTLVFADPHAADRNNQIGRYFRQMLERTHHAMEPLKKQG